MVLLHCCTCEKHIVILALNRYLPSKERIFHKQGHLTFQKTPATSELETDIPEARSHDRKTPPSRSAQAQHHSITYKELKKRTALQHSLRKHTALGHSHPNIMVVN